MTVSTLTYNVASRIISGVAFGLDKFHSEGGCNQYIMFAHHNFFYSYENVWDKNGERVSYQNGKDQWIEYHQLNIKCHLCDDEIERNHAGAGTIYLLHNGISDDEILTGKKGNYHYIKNTPKLSQFICLCQEHIKGYFPFTQQLIQRKTNQLELF